MFFIIYLIIWFWPTALHRPFFNDNNESSTVNNPRYEPSGGVLTENDQRPNEGFDPRFGDDGYEDPIVETPYDGSDPDPIAPLHSADELNDPVACTMEAKACPDGSYVGRQGPNCEFAPCSGN